MFIRDAQGMYLNTNVCVRQGSTWEWPVIQTNESIYWRLCECTWLFHALRSNRDSQPYFTVTANEPQRSKVQIGSRRHLMEEKVKLKYQRNHLVCENVFCVHCKTSKTKTKTSPKHLHVFPCDKLETFPFDLFRALSCISSKLFAKFKNNHGWFAYQTQTLYI